VLVGPLSLPAAGAGAVRLGRGRGAHTKDYVATPLSHHWQVLECIDDENERGVRHLVTADARMGAAMKSFLLRCLDRSPNSRPAAIDLMSDPWLTGVNQDVRILIPPGPLLCHARSRCSLRL
jgi:hypothetical protein